MTSKRKLWINLTSYDIGPNKKKKEFVMAALLFETYMKEKMNEVFKNSNDFALKILSFVLTLLSYYIKTMQVIKQL